MVLVHDGLICCRNGSRRMTAGVPAAIVVPINSDHGGKRMPSPDLMSHDVGPSKGPLGRWLEKLGLHRPELRAWAMYDWANSAMVTTIITAVFPIYYANVACKGVFELEEATATVRDGNGDRHGHHRVPLARAGNDCRLEGRQEEDAGRLPGPGSLCRWPGCSSSIKGDWILASVLFILANIGANGSFVFYDALLPHVAREDEIDRVSTAGYALGYIGGGTLLALNLAWIMKPAWFGLPSGDGLTPEQATLPTRLAFLSVAVWWLVFSIPLFRRVAEPPAAGDGRAAGFPIRAAFAQLVGHRPRLAQPPPSVPDAAGVPDLQRWHRHDHPDGDDLRHRDRDRSGRSMIAAIMIVQFVGIPCAFLFGMLAHRIGAKRSIGVGLVAYMAICVLGYFMTTATHFVVLAVLVGAVQGGTQALSRSLFASLIPRDKSGEFFGFFGVAEKFAGILGPAVFTVGSSRIAILAIIAFFVVGGALLFFVDVAGGQRLARADEAGALPE